MFGRLLVGSIVAIGAVLALSRTSAQVVREDGQKSIAGVIGGSYPDTAWWTFKSSGGEILFASLDAEIYKAREHHEHEIGTSSTAGGCGEETQARFCLQLVDSAETIICQVSRPAPPPGWQIDPRFACLLPQTGSPVTYTIRVSAASHEGGCSTSSPAPTVADERPFLLNVSLRRVVASGSLIHQASAQSGNRF